MKSSRGLDKAQRESRVKDLSRTGRTGPLLLLYKDGRRRIVVSSVSPTHQPFTLYAIPIYFLPFSYFLLWEMATPQGFRLIDALPVTRSLSQGPRGWKKKEWNGWRGTERRRRLGRRAMDDFSLRLAILLPRAALVWGKGSIDVRCLGSHADALLSSFFLWRCLNLSPHCLYSPR